MGESNQSAAKHLSSTEYGEGSQTIAKASTLNCKLTETGDTLTHKGEGKDIVETKREMFIEKSVKKFNNRFIYDNVIYVNTKTKVSIECVQHGFFQQTPDKHLRSKNPCPICYSEHRKGLKHNVTVIKEKKPFTHFKSKIKKKFNIDVEYVSGEGRETIFKLDCPIHGEVNEKVDNVLKTKRKYVCQKCSKKNRTINKTHDVEHVKNEINKLHPTIEVDYENYVNKRTKLKCYCKKHGIFYKNVSKLLVNQGCPKCVFDKLIKKNRLIGGYNNRLFENNKGVRNRIGFLYFIRVGEYYKIGITINIKRRLSSIKNKSGREVELIFLKESTLYESYLNEQQILKDFNDHRIYRKWSTELFSKNITDDISHIFS